MSFTVQLKSGERYEFHKIKTVKIENKEDGKLITINGNFKKQGKYKFIVLWRRIINNIKSFENWLQSTKKLYEFEGTCPKCESLDLTRFDKQTWGLKLNNYRGSSFLLKSELIHIKCNKCRHTFDDEQIKYNSTMVYY